MTKSNFGMTKTKFSIYLEESDLRLLSNWSDETGASIAELVRRAIRKTYGPVRMEEEQSRVEDRIR